jgi:hypothetical protein
MQIKPFFCVDEETSIFCWHKKTAKSWPDFHTKMLSTAFFFSHSTTLLFVVDFVSLNHSRSSITALETP